MSTEMLSASLAQAVLIFAALSSSESTILGAIIAGVFLLANTALTLYLTSRRREVRQIIEEEDLVAKERARKAGAAKKRHRARPPGIQRRPDHPDD